jgi:3-dehydro-4-phosphotetronate decarboxylase
MLSEPALSESKAREAICLTGRSLFERGYVHATAGNISMRLSDGFLITPTDACLGFLDPATISKLSFSGEQISGARASKTISLHRAIYASTEAFTASAQAVIHTHSTHCVALSLQAPTAGDSPWPDLLAPITPYFVMKVGHVPRIAYQRPGAPEAAKQVQQAITHFFARGITLRAAMLDRLGPNVWHQSLSAAMATLEELEETAKLWALAQPKPLPLEASAIQELRDHFGAQW